jgi:hypothetical protein
MGNRRISPELKECALNLWAKGWELKDITDTLLVSQASLYRWRAIFEDRTSVIKTPCAPLGLTRTRLTRAVLTAPRTVYTQAANPELYLDELVLWLSLRYDIAIAVPDLQQHLTKDGLTREILLNIALERDEVLLQQWRDTLAGDDFVTDGSQFICVDETSKHKHAYGKHHGPTYSGDQTELRDVFVRGDMYTLVGALSVDGWIAADVSGSKFDSNEFLEFVQEHVVRLMFPFIL